MQNASEAVSPAGRGDKPNPRSVRGGSKDSPEGNARKMVAFVDDDQPVAGEALVGIRPSSQTLQSHQIDDPTAAVPTGPQLTNLPRVETQQFAETLMQLFGRSVCTSASVGVANREMGGMATGSSDVGAEKDPI
jgi:hypothetical protein